MEGKKPECVAFFHGETWYKCPFCGKQFEYYFTQNGRGFEETKTPKVYKHECGGLVDMT